MRNARVLFYLVAAVTVLLLVPAASAQDRCYEACADPTVSCDTPCWTCQIEHPDGYCNYWDTIYTTCGEFGMSCDQCSPYWVEVSRTKIGGNADVEINFLGIRVCRFVEWFTVTERDLNNCGPTEYRQRCDQDEHWGDWFTDTCCDFTDPEDIDRTEYCGGSSC